MREGAGGREGSRGPSIRADVPGDSGSRRRRPDQDGRAEDEPSRKPKGIAMSGLECPPSTRPEVVVELRRGAVLGLLWLEIEAMRLRLEIDSLRRLPAVELFEED